MSAKLASARARAQSAHITLAQRSRCALFW